MSWGPLQILLILLIVVLLFGTKKLRNLGGDLGSSIKSFKKSMSESEKKTASSGDKQQTLAKNEGEEEEFVSGEQQGRVDKDKIR